jgi:hypothetical protein
MTSDDDIMPGWPEYGIMLGSRVRLTVGYVRGLSDDAKRELEIVRDGQRVRPFRMGSLDSDIVAVPGRRLSV